ncbi:hypothetical protein O7598_31065 [Micromonospora sp. WMMC241]|uniref:hypothetical protein n=1 Tax=Micromonospora sp. WMMC241 TaxID=3015159 RepID=UPI0022B693FC|nr:hypothetical protein [Micromonospora sp. WMMC241]MCZ7440807.1 hypothetical protein [Micromonospora sp. WMMC241]MCZ7440866.1 hypothetical protein [Micromonospora sp. WMMC241]
MAWTSPPTFTDGSVLTAAQLNLLRDDLNETAPAKATQAGRLIVTTGLNSVAERDVVSSAIATTQTTGSTSFVDLTTPGPTVTVTTGSAAILLWSALMSNSTANAKTYVDYTVSGASSRSAQDASALRFQSDSANQEARSGQVMFEGGLTPGSNTFKLQYHTNGGTGSFSDRRLTVIAL